MSVRVQIDDSETPASAGASIFDCSELMSDVRIPTSCQKNGKCRECMVEVDEGMHHLSPRSPEESHLGGDFRLSCRAQIVSDEGTVRCRTLRRGALQISNDGIAPAQFQIDPAVEQRDGEVNGVAVDLGTTTVVARLVDLKTGTVRATRSFENPQRFGGSDVMARIQYDCDHKGRLLQRALLGYLTHAIEDFPCNAESIFEIVVAGNSTMRDLFFGLDVHSIGQKPYRSTTEHELRAGDRESTSLTHPATRFGLPVNPTAQVYSPPLISGHVGADTAACLLAIDLADEDELVALMDIGTNTEFVIGNREKLFVASCPAGPAFEGGVIRCGMPGLEGAIESLAITDEGTVSYETIGGGEAKGICGSGIVDLLAELLRTDRMNELGRYTDESDEFVVDAAKDIVLTEEDISQLAQAKAANVAGAQIVLQQSGFDVSKITKFYLAGGFAKHLDLDAAKAIGLIPDFPDSVITPIGNAAIEGATIALLSSSRREALEQLIRKATHVELETDETFFDHFVDGCQFRPADVGLTETA